MCSSGRSELCTRQKSILDEVRLERTIANGKFGKVYLGEWRSGKVAVKRFETRNTISYENEKLMYETSMFHHENLLHCIMCGRKCAPLTGEGVLCAEGICMHTTN